MILACIKIERYTFRHFRINGAVVKYVILHLFTVCQCTERICSIQAAPVDGSAVEVTAVACHGTATTATDVATPVVVPDVAILSEAVLVDGAVVVSQPTHGEGSVGSCSKGFVGAIDDLGG